MHVLPEGMDSLPDLPEEEPGNASVVKKDPSEEGESLGVNNGGIPTNGASGTSINGEQQTIKANKGMILRKVSRCPLHHPHYIQILYAYIRISAHIRCVMVIPDACMRVSGVFIRANPVSITQ